MINPKRISKGYKQLKDENDFDSFLDRINQAREMNLNENLSNEDRRKNAENAILMLAKFMNLDEDFDSLNEPIEDEY